MKQFILTEGGNLLRFHEVLNKPYFETPSGEFIRECSNNEFDHLCKLGILCESNDQRLEIEPKFFPLWHFIRSELVVADYSNYRPETSSNGGNYSFHVYHDWFCAKFPNGQWKFCFIERQSTSAEFSFDELSGAFQSDLGEIYLSNVEDNISYRTQIGRVWDDENECWYSSIPEVVEKIGTMAKFEQLWNEMYHYIPLSWDENDSEMLFPALKLKDKKEIISKLRQLGFPRNSKNFRIKKSNRR